jgi:hypothetical protein
MSKLTTLAAGAALACVALGLATPIADAQPKSDAGACLNFTQVGGQRLADPHTLYLRAGRYIYRLGFANDCNTAVNETLIMHPVTNNDVICSAIELNVRVRETGESCVPNSLTRLTPDEAAALPPRDRP